MSPERCPSVFQTNLVEGRERKGKRGRGRDRDRQTEADRYRQTDKERARERQRDWNRQIQTDRRTERERERKRDAISVIYQSSFPIPEQIYQFSSSRFRWFYVLTHQQSQKPRQIWHSDG